ncbi:MAG: response regulator transcription factor [Clostridia bacterium]|nr:response regulator transcription factor [Clostridia bacterium]
MIKVLLCDDQTLLTQSLRTVIESYGDIMVCGIAKDGEEALEICKAAHPDVVLMDIRMPAMNGVVATKKIKELDDNIKVIVLTTFDDSDYILGAINNGASGYLLKDIGAEALVDSIRSAVKGDTILPTKIAKKITDAAMLVSDDKEIKLKKTYGLSDREAEIADMIFDGFTNRQISSALKISDGTVRNYISTVYMKLGVDNRADAVALMKKLGK